MSKIHQLKIWPEYFDKVASGAKKFELRKNDRDYQVGDVLILQAFDPNTQRFVSEQGSSTVLTVSARVTYMIQGAFGLPEDVCVMSIDVIRGAA